MLGQVPVQVLVREQALEPAQPLVQALALARVLELVVAVVATGHRRNPDGL